MQRRELFPILGMALAAGPLVGAEPRVFTGSEFALLRQLCELLLPADETGPGATEAGVAEYIDLTLQYGTEQERALWRSGLLAVEALAQRECGKGFGACSAAEQAKVMDRMAAGEQKPESAAERFFGMWKAAAVQGFGWSVAGRKALGYQGDKMTGTFTGCTHAGRHQA
ncbi:MAG: gluconate 2-dehydrogenase subunit 3 family protein [Bryobacterales bacterium]|nr:gluconate 2-dehydrogenase subunit 3 family protein [Bryobacterales bacterium]